LSKVKSRENLAGKPGTFINILKQKSKLLELIPDHAVKNMEQENIRLYVYNCVPEIVKTFIFDEFTDEAQRGTILYSYVSIRTVRLLIIDMIKKKYNRNIFIGGLRKANITVSESDSS